MTTTIRPLLTLAMLLSLVMAVTGCGQFPSGRTAMPDSTDTIAVDTAAVDSAVVDSIALDSVAAVDTTAGGQAEALPPRIRICGDSVAYDKDRAFIVVSKRDLCLTVYAPSGSDTVAVATFPVCMGKNKGDKVMSGDMRTPESPAGHPFTITMIQDASTWKHDFGDGRGKIYAYGHWFLRLDTPGHQGIGIHGSTNNEGSVPGRASEGCIRMRDRDIITLKEKFARVGMPVIVKGEQQGLLPFEEKCVVR